MESFGPPLSCEGWGGGGGVGGVWRNNEPLGPHRPHGQWALETPRRLTWRGGGGGGALPKPLQDNGVGQGGGGGRVQQVGTPRHKIQAFHKHV